MRYRFLLRFTSFSLSPFLKYILDAGKRDRLYRYTYRVYLTFLVSFSFLLLPSRKLWHSRLRVTLILVRAHALTQMEIYSHTERMHALQAEMYRWQFFFFHFLCSDEFLNQCKLKKLSFSSRIVSVKERNLVQVSLVCVIKFL